MKYLMVFLILFSIISCKKTSEIKRQQLFLKGNIALEENDLKQAVYYYNQCIELSDTIPAPFNNRAIAYERMGDFQEAFSDYERAIIISPNFYEAYFNRAKLLNEIKNHKSALIDLEQIAIPYQDSMSFYFVKGMANTGLGRYEAAATDFSKAKKLQPQNEEIDINLATVFYYSGQYNQSMTTINDVLESNKIPEALNLKALLLIEKGEFNEAELLINDALKLNSNSFYYNNRGYIRLLKGELEEGFKDINQSLLMDDDNSWAYRNKGIYFFLVKEYKQALNFLNTSLELDPKTRKSHYYLGLVYQEMGNIELACQHWQISLNQGEKKGAELFNSFCAH